MKRIVVKLSGEMLAGNQGFGIEPETIRRFAEEIKEVKEEGIEVALVIGSPGKVIRQVTDEEIKHVKENAEHYVNNYKKYKNLGN